MKKTLGLFLLGLFGLSLTGCGSSIGAYADADKYLAGNQTYSESITSLDVDWVSGTLTLVEDVTIEGVKIEEDTNLTKEQELVHSYLNNGELKIKYFASGYVKTGFSKIIKNLTVTYNPGLSVIDVDLTSGKLNAETMTAEKVNIDMTSGSANIGVIIAKDGDMDMTSGNMTINHVAATNFDVDLTSGDIKVGFDSIENASFDSTSGTIDMTLPLAGGEVKVSKTSGSVTTNRECSVSNNTYKFGDGGSKIKVSMTSGKLIIG